MRVKRSLVALVGRKNPVVTTAPSYRPYHPWIAAASYLLMAGTLLLIMWRGLLPGLLSVCVGFVLARLITRGLSIPQHTRRGAWIPIRLRNALAVGILAIAPLLLLAWALTQTRGFIVEVPAQYREMLSYMANTVLELRLKLPADLAGYLPEGTADIQRTIANYLSARAGTLALAGRAWLAGLLFVYVGLLIGALAAVREIPLSHGPLAQQMSLRIRRFGDAFHQIIAAQFWIAAFNTLLTALFLLFILPFWDLRLPYTPVLITLTFVAGLIPIVGNLLCNVVLTIVGLSVSPTTAAACLGFLILIHKAEYVINAKVVGQRTQMGVWELLSVMFVSEAVFGPAGLVAAPLFYAYLKKELIAAGLV